MLFYETLRSYEYFKIRYCVWMVIGAASTELYRKNLKFDFISTKFMFFEKYIFRLAMFLDGQLDCWNINSIALQTKLEQLKYLLLFLKFCIVQCTLVLVTKFSNMIGNKTLRNFLTWAIILKHIILNILDVNPHCWSCPKTHKLRIIISMLMKFVSQPPPTFHFKLTDPSTTVQIPPISKRKSYRMMRWQQSIYHCFNVLKLGPIDSKSLFLLYLFQLRV